MTQSFKTEIHEEQPRDSVESPDQEPAVRSYSENGAGDLSAEINPLPTWKRSFDLVGTSLGLLLLAPLFLLIATVIKLSSSGPVFFKHKRYGWLGKPFYVWKFRTMHEHVDPGKHRQHLEELMDGQQSLKKLSSADLIPCGAFLRSTAIDELPQLINVLRGEMSLVGPRPDVVPVGAYQPWQRTRFQVVPGMTGLWQVSGKNKTTFQEMVELDIQYIERRSLMFDSRILLRTGPAIVEIIVQDLLTIRA